MAKKLPRRKLAPFDLADVTVDDAFWAPRLETNRTVTLPHEYQQCKDTGRLDAFRLDWTPDQGNPPHVFWDSDIAKWIEAASYALTSHPDPRLERQVNDAAALVASAQQPDGYLNVHFTIVEPDKRWTNLRDAHELYCAGHLMEAAVAHHRATGSRVLLDALARYADHINKTFGRGKRTGYPGHEEIELALVKLYHETGERRYLKLSKYFIDQRGQEPHVFDREARARGEDPKNYWAGGYDYCQAHLPVREQRDAVGHSVRAMYLYSGMADVAGETGDASLLRACRRLWDSATLRRMYITGGVGSTGHGERFTRDYHLPNATAYAETCAAIGLVFFAHRMLQIEAHGRYADVMERALYNGVLSGVSLDGKHFFYRNPLESAGDHHRPEWFGCACCPPNLARLLASLGQYIYSATDRAAYVHLYVGGQGQATVGGNRITLTQKTDYPWSGKVKLTVGVETPASFALLLRIPDWCRRHRIKVNGKPLSAKVTKGYARIRRKWKDGDHVELSMRMPVERIVAHPDVAEDTGRVALQRGPLVYCLESCDHGTDVRAIVLPDAEGLRARFEPDLFGGTTVIEGSALAPTGEGWRRALYRRAAETKTRKIPLRAIPYCLWDNRAAGSMAVWLPRL